MALVLCPTCRRHVFETEERCPFCSGAIAAADRRVAVAPAGRSRAQRYALGAAIAASVGVAHLTGGKRARAADGGGLLDAASDAEGPVEAGDGDGATSNDASAMNNGSTFDAGANQLPPQEWHSGGGACTNSGGCCGSTSVCPPYGCVFVDDGCDFVHA